jgi:hypothetical protein
VHRSNSIAVNEYRLVMRQCPELTFRHWSSDCRLEVNAEKTKCLVMSRDQNAGRNGNIQIGNESFETVEQFKYLGQP